MSRLTLGTVAQGLRYGVVNAAGDPTTESATAIFEAAWHAGITCFDTARAYGEAESRLGAWLADRTIDPVLISKLLPADGSAGATTVMDDFARSLNALRKQRLFGFLAHRPSDLAIPAIQRGLQTLRSEGSISRFGASLYTVAELERALTVPDIGIVQIPMSVANMTMAQSGLVRQAAGQDVLVFVRSVFLQGVLLSDPDRIPDALAGLREPVRKLHRLAAAAKTSVAAITLAAVDDVPGVHSIVVGAETPQQIEQTVEAFCSARPEPDILRQACSYFADLPDDLTDPSRWPCL